MTYLDDIVCAVKCNGLTTIKLHKHKIVFCQTMISFLMYVQKGFPAAEASEMSKQKFPPAEVNCWIYFKQ